jgi:hypothetical protein
MAEVSIFMSTVRFCPFNIYFYAIYNHKCMKMSAKLLPSYITPFRCKILWSEYIASPAMIGASGLGGYTIRPVLRYTPPPSNLKG